MNMLIAVLSCFFLILLFCAIAGAVAAFVQDEEDDEAFWFVAGTFNGWLIVLLFFTLLNLL